MMTYLLLIIGFVLLLKGADFLVDGATAIAQKFRVSSLVIGLTVVAFGTSVPELVINIYSSIEAQNDLVISNIIGSNLSNTLLILGVCAVIYPIAVKKSTVWKEIPLNILGVLMLGAVVNDVILDGATTNTMSRIDGIVMLGFFAVFLFYTYSLATAYKEKSDGKMNISTWRAVLLMVIGVIGLTFGGREIVNSAVVISESLGLSKAFIGLTVLAIGTSLPELATSAMAAYKKNADLAVGNIIGSNIFNIFWVLGISSVIHPVLFNARLNTDILVNLAASLLLFAFMFTRRKYGLLRRKEMHVLGRYHGVVLLASYLIYIGYLVYRG